MKRADKPDKPGHRTNVRRTKTRTDTDTPLRGVRLSGVRSRRPRPPRRTVMPQGEEDARPWWLRDD